MRASAVGFLVVVVAAGCAAPQATTGRAGGASTATAPAADPAVLERLGMCSAAAFRAHSQASSAGAREMFGRLYTNALYAAVAVSSKKEAANAHALGTVMVMMMEGRGADVLEAWVTRTFETCDADLAALLGKLASVARPAEALAPRVQQTMPLDLLAALGKPSHEDYNVDGRFVYLYETKLGSDAYLFDVTGRLIRVTSYCDSTKGACPDQAK